MTIRVQKNLWTGFRIFILTEIMIFFCMFWAFINFGVLQTSSFVLLNYPPKGIVPIFPLGIPLANVLILLYSSLPLQAAQIWIKKGVKSRTLVCIQQTIVCGVLFLYLQLKEYTSAFFTISDAMYGSGFYATTGLHGMHVTLGLMGFILFTTLIKTNKMYKELHMSLKLWSWYWHLVDFLWIMVYFVFYLWGYNWSILS